MTWGEIENRIMEDLGVGGKLSRKYTAMFREKFKGQKQFIEDFHVSLTDTGRLRFRYKIKGKAEYEFKYA